MENSSNLKVVVIIILFMISNCTSVLAQKVKSIDIFALPYNTLFTADITKKEIRRDFDIHVEILDREVISVLDSIYNSKNFEPFTKAKTINDFRVLVIFNYTYFKRKKCYFTGTDLMLVNNGIFKSNMDFIRKVYSLFPKSYYWEL